VGVTRVVRIHIQELVLEGVAPGDRYRVTEAIQAELVRLVASERSPSFIASTDRVDARAVTAGPPRPFGTEVARSIYGGLRR
jgi:hypothetical protein